MEPDELDPDESDDMVDWDDLASGFFGRTPYLDHISQTGMALLLGWATHLHGPDAAHCTPPTSPLDGLPNDPLPPSMHGYIGDVASQILERAEQQNKDRKPVTLFEAFDASALDALGVILEDMVTATLLPLARRHVARCRALDDTDAEAAFEAWTLPPEEAIAALSRDLDEPAALTGIATARPATYVTKSPRKDVPIDPEQAIQRWCASQNITRRFVRDNMNIFQHFVGSETGSATDHG